MYSRARHEKTVSQRRKTPQNIANLFICLSCKPELSVVYTVSIPSLFIIRHLSEICVSKRNLKVRQILVLASALLRKTDAAVGGWSAKYTLKFAPLDGIFLSRPLLFCESHPQAEVSRQEWGSTFKVQLHWLSDIVTSTLRHVYRPMALFYQSPILPKMLFYPKASAASFWGMNTPNPVICLE